MHIISWVSRNCVEGVGGGRGGGVSVKCFHKFNLGGEVWVVYTMSDSNTDVPGDKVVFAFAFVFTLGLLAGYVVDGVSVSFELAVLGYLAVACMLLTGILIKVSE